MIRNKYFIITIFASCLCISDCIPSNNTLYCDAGHVQDSSQLATETLQREFEIIKRTLNILEKASYCLDAGKPVSKETFCEIIEIIREFSDKCHQEKEDKVLFPFLKNAQGGEKKDFLGQLLMEHVSARDEIRDLSGAINYIHLGKKYKKKITKIAYAYIKHTKKHIQMEEKSLFPWINKVLTHDDQTMLINKFDEMGKMDISAGVHEKYTTMIEKIEGQLEFCNK